MKALVRYFDLHSEIRPLRAASAGQRPLPWQFQWVALLLGILIQPFFAHYQAHHEWKFDGFWGWAAFAAITALVVFPAVYKNSFDPTKPMVIQVIPIFTAGLGWQSLLTTAVKLATPL